eukprot:TRINITY_DN5469_c0_g4_i2.p1 TRINITY_DN5469_c0_g4~~TRINITY_DN5469_c0_g4_i2.p1  ORF type:complete len:535 (-),score=190.38 TRINITY_DN5469_c0_g4_i2:706-2265(-)
MCIRDSINAEYMGILTGKMNPVDEKPGKEESVGSSAGGKTEGGKLKVDAVPFCPKPIEPKSAAGGKEESKKEEGKRSELNAHARAFIPRKAMTGEHKDIQGAARGSVYPEFLKGGHMNYAPSSIEAGQMFSPMGGYQRPPYMGGYGAQNYPPFYYKFPGMNYPQGPMGFAKGSAEEMQAKRTVVTSKPVIKTDVVVGPAVHKKPTTAETIPKEVSGKADKEEKKREVKEAETKKEMKSPRDQKKDSPKQAKKEEKKPVEELLIEIKKSLKMPIVEPTEDKQEDSDLSKLKEILNKKKTTKRAFTYEVIMEIGRELKICRRRPVLLAKDLLGRTTELYDISGSPVGKKPQNIERRAEPEEVTKLKMDAKNQLERITEEAKVENDEKEIKFALNKLTPDNYGKQLTLIYALKSKSDELQKMLINMLFKKAWSEQKYIELYGNLCKDFVCKELGLDPKKNVSPLATAKSSFGAAIVARLTDAFEKRNEFKEEIKALRQDYTDEEVYFNHRNMLFGSICRSNE